MDNGILLKSGIGELEILEFVINNKHYAINVIKVKEVIDVDNLTQLPDSHPAIAGLILCRNEIITLIDLKYILEGQKSSQNKSKVVICEFNQIKVAFNIDDIVAVHRIKWENIVNPDDMSTSSLVTGNILLNKEIILLLDFEKIVTDINPGLGISEEKVINIKYKDRSNIKIILVDDSALVRKLLKDTLTKAGFKNLKVFNDGKQALNYLYDLVKSRNEKFIQNVQLLITDIEMPQMDGHTLTRNIKEHSILHKLPVIIFSSLITDQLKHKGKEVGADEQLSKSEIGQLVECIDKYIDKLF